MNIRINLIPVVSDTQVILLNQSDLDLSNVSDANRVVTGYISGSGGFQLSTDSVELSNLQGIPLFGEQGYPGILSRTLSDDNGATSFKVDFIFEGVLPNHIYIGFDNVVHEYALDFTLTNAASDNTIHVSNNKSTFLRLDISKLIMPSNNLFTLHITKWSKPNSSIRLTSLSVTPAIQLTTRDIITSEWSENMLDVDMEKNPGVCEQYADIRFYDRSGVVTTLAQQDEIRDKYKIEILVNDNVENTYMSQDWDVDTDDSIFLLKGADYYYLFSGIKVPAQNVKDRSLNEMLTWIFDIIGVPWSWGTFNLADPDTLVTPDSWFYASTVGEILQKLCNAFALRIYWLCDKYVVEGLW